MREKHGVEAVGLEVPEARIEILLDNVKASLYTGLYFVAVDFESGAFHLFGQLKVREQATVTAAEVEHAAVRFYPALNYLLIRTHR